MQFVLEMRAQVLDAQRGGEQGLEALEEDIAHLLNRWCQHGLLLLEEINRRSSYRTVNFLKEREMVHPMVSLDEMGQRLGPTACASPSITWRCRKSPSSSSRLL